MELTGRTVLITGGGSGLGAATARMVVEAGGSVVAADVDAERGKRVADQLGERARFVATDVTDEDSVRAAVAAATEAGGLHVAPLLAPGRAGEPESLASGTAGGCRTVPLSVEGRSGRRGHRGQDGAGHRRRVGAGSGHGQDGGRRGRVGRGGRRRP